MKNSIKIIFTSFQYVEENKPQRIFAVFKQLDELIEAGCSNELSQYMIEYINDVIISLTEPYSKEITLMMRDFIKKIIVKLSQDQVYNLVNAFFSMFYMQHAYYNFTTIIEILIQFSYQNIQGLILHVLNYIIQGAFQGNNPELNNRLIFNMQNPTDFTCFYKHLLQYPDYLKDQQIKDAFYQNLRTIIDKMKNSQEIEYFSSILHYLYGLEYLDNISKFIIENITSEKIALLLKYYENIVDKNANVQLIAYQNLFSVLQSCNYNEYAKLIRFMSRFFHPTYKEQIRNILQELIDSKIKELQNAGDIFEKLISDLNELLLLANKALTEIINDDSLKIKYIISDDWKIYEGDQLIGTAIDKYEQFFIVKTDSASKIIYIPDQF